MVSWSSYLLKHVTTSTNKIWRWQRLLLILIAGGTFSLLFYYSFAMLVHKINPFNKLSTNCHKLLLLLYELDCVILYLRQPTSCLPIKPPFGMSNLIHFIIGYSSSNSFPWFPPGFWSFWQTNEFHNLFLQHARAHDKNNMISEMSYIITNFSLVWLLYKINTTKCCFPSLKALQHITSSWSRYMHQFMLESLCEGHV